MNTAMNAAFSEIKDNIQYVVDTFPLKRDDMPCGYFNGYAIVWHENGHGGLLPTLRTAECYIPYPTINGEIGVPVGTKRATYNAEKRRVEYFDSKGEMLQANRNARHRPIPVPVYMNDLNRVEDINELDMETGEITSSTFFDLMEENVYWKVCLKEFERQQKLEGVPAHIIERYTAKHKRNLFVTRGITEADLSGPIPKNVVAAMEYAAQRYLK